MQALIFLQKPLPQVLAHPLDTEAHETTDCILTPLDEINCIEPSVKCFKVRFNTSPALRLMPIGSVRCMFAGVLGLAGLNETFGDLDVD